MHFPDKLRYTRDHEWALLEGNTVTVGITDHAQAALGDIVYVDLPKVGRELKAHETFGVVESIKAVSDLYAPLAGRVKEINSAVVEDPSLLNREPHTQGWMLKLEISDTSQLSGLMDAAAYSAYVDSLK